MTDLGTEFGVEVDKLGGTVSHVFRGLVEVQLVAYEGQPGQTVRLTENESIRVKNAGSGDVLSMQKDTVDPAVFVRTEQLPAIAKEFVLKPLRRWQAYREQLRNDPTLVAYYTFEAAPQGDIRVLPNLSTAGTTLDGQVEGAEWVMGRLPGKCALLFRGPGSGDRVVLPDQNRFNFDGPFSVAVWFRIAQVGTEHQGLVTKGNFSWRLQQRDATNTLGFFTNAADHDNGSIVRANGEVEVADGRWHLAVGVYEPVDDVVHQRLYVDGHLDVETQSPWRLRHTDNPVWLGANSGSGVENLGFQGWIDEVAIFARALSAEEAVAMFNAGNPA